MRPKPSPSAWRRPGGIFDPSRLAEEIEILEHKASQPGFWDDQKKAQGLMQELNTARQQAERLKRWKGVLEDFETALELDAGLSDEELWGQVAQGLSTTTRELDEWELEQLLSDPNDQRPAILSVSAGAGGTDAADWALMLFRMYGRWCEDKGLKAVVTDYTENEEAGIKGATMIVTGPHAYGKLKAEKGTHRLVRISPFNANDKRQTSFAGVDVIPEFDDNLDEDFDIPAKELRIDTFRSGGAGGQNVNKVETAIRITHLPTNTVATCQNERSQLQNRETAMRMLKARLLDRMRAEHASMIADLKGPQSDAAWGHQIRSYFLHPYTMVKDHRTGVDTTQAHDVLEGNLDAFIDGYLRALAKGELKDGGGED